MRSSNSSHGSVHPCAQGTSPGESFASCSRSPSPQTSAGSLPRLPRLQALALCYYPANHKNLFRASLDSTTERSRAMVKPSEGRFVALAAIAALVPLVVACSSPDRGDGPDAPAAAADDAAVYVEKPPEYVLQQEFPLSIELTSSVFNRSGAFPSSTPAPRTTTILRQAPTFDMARTNRRHWPGPASRRAQRALPSLSTTPTR